MASGGAWKSIEEMEDCITIDELNVLLDAHREAEFQRQKFAAALKGVDLGERTSGASGSEKTFEDIRREAEQEILGENVGHLSEKADLAQFGIRVEEE